MAAETVESEITAWFEPRLPRAWFASLEVGVDADEILVTVGLPPEGSPGEAAGTEPAVARIARFREETREERMKIAEEAQSLFNRKVSWGASLGVTSTLFTHLSLPVMTRLRLPERAVLDTLVAAGVARSRSHALAWCARLVAENQSEWLEKLRKAYAEVEKARREGPTTISMA